MQPHEVAERATAAEPAEEVPLRNDMLIFGVHSLPVTWA